MIRKAIFPGTFDPLTNGHVDLVMRAKKLFCEVLIAVAEDTTGKQPHFSFAERLHMVSVVFAEDPAIVVKGFSGLLVDFYLQEKADVLIRGVRSSKDFDYEFEMTQVNQLLAPKVETILMITSPGKGAISASMIREMARLGKDISGFVPAAVAEALVDL